MGILGKIQQGPSDLRICREWFLDEHMGPGPEKTPGHGGVALDGRTHVGGQPRRDGLHGVVEIDPGWTVPGPRCERSRRPGIGVDDTRDRNPQATQGVGVPATHEARAHDQGRRVRCDWHVCGAGCLKKSLSVGERMIPMQGSKGYRVSDEEPTLLDCTSPPFPPPDCCASRAWSS